ncbi:hypothetical protein BGZ89_000456 [Linnemannia elongata]|nr:hypothetical protein BGZ89_000456 [Linnemannia elongata]
MPIPATNLTAPVPAGAPMMKGRFHSGQTTLSLRTPERRRLRLFRTTQKQNQQYQQQQEQEEDERYSMDAEVEAEEQEIMSSSSMDVDVDVEEVEMEREKGPAILRLCPEVLALIFHYVYVTPVVHRPLPTSAASVVAASVDNELQPPPSPSQAQTQQQQQHQHQQEEHEGQSQQESSMASVINLVILAPILFLLFDFFVVIIIFFFIFFIKYVDWCDTTTSRRNNNHVRHTIDNLRGGNNHKTKQEQKSFGALCLTCRAFYPQAIRMLWRQRTLTNFEELTQFYQAIDFSATLTKRHQKQRLLQQQQQIQHLQQLGMGIEGYAMEEGLFTNKAALRIKSLTLLDMSLGSSLDSLPLASVVASANAASSTSVESGSLSNPFFGSSSNHAGGDPASLDLCRGIDSLAPRNSSALDDSLAMAGLSKEDATIVLASSSSSSSSSSSPSQSAVIRSPSQSRRRNRQKTTSIYSDMVSPRLLHTIAHHCHALVDLTLCMDKKSLSSSLSSRTTTPAVHQPTIPLSILAGSLLSLKRLALMGLVCDPEKNKTGSELLVFAEHIQPLERLSIRSCQGIGLETFVALASRSSSRLLSVDFQGLDFKTSQELTDVMAAFARHCRSIKSVTLSCLNSLAMDGMLEAWAHYQPCELQELHVLGHDTFLTPAQLQQQQQQGLGGVGVPAPNAAAVPPPQQQQADTILPDGGVPVPFTQMCHLADANAALSSLSQIPLRRLTLYCPGITDYALLLYLAQSKHLVDLVLQEPTSMVIHHPQFHNFVQQYHPFGSPPPSTPAAEDDAPFDQPPPVASTGSSAFLGLIKARCTGLKYLFMKLTLETAQEWIAQECFRQAGLDKCLFQYRTATGAPAVVLMWDSRTQVPAPAATAIVPS